MSISLTEMQGDLEATIRDIDCLNGIVKNLVVFISQSHGEDRSVFRTDLLKYGALKDTAQRLKTKIVQAIAQSNT